MLKKASPIAADHDLVSTEGKVVPTEGKKIVDTQLTIAVPQMTYRGIAPHSGLAAKHMIQVGARVINANYRGLIGVILFNHGEKNLSTTKGIE